LLAKTLEAALTITRTDLGNVQLLDPASGTLTIDAHTGFDDEFLEYFAVVDDEAAACGRAVQDHAQVVIRDVASDPRFVPHRGIAASAGFQAVQSTPITAEGRILGVVSTHFRRPGQPTDAELRSLALLGELAGSALAAHLGETRPSLTEELDEYLAAMSELAELRTRVGQLQQALVSRVAIEQAKGIIAATSEIPVDEAFDRLRRYARRHNRAIRDVAEAVVRRGLRP
jgi:GAF domain-containing protein